jgi:hypothetical protein
MQSFPIATLTRFFRRWRGWGRGLRVGVVAFGVVASPMGLRIAAGEDSQPYTIRRQDQVWWLYSPQAQPFFSRGVCCVIPGAAKPSYDPENPEYAAWRYYATDTNWAATAVQRLQAWGFTTAGGWSDARLLRRVPGMRLGLTPVLHIGSTAGAPWWDMWDAQIVQRMDDLARTQILAVRDDPRLIGYYSDNELGWWNATLFKMTLEQAPASGQRQRLIKLLRQHYHDDWTALLRDFDAENAAGWKALNRRGMLFLRPGGEGIQVMRKFLGLLADRYYQLTHDLIRKYDPRGLVLGDRYQSFYYPEVARACERYVDAVSSNLNASWNDGTWARFYLATLHELTHKPIFVSEYYMAAAANRSGNQNSQGIFPVAPDQRQRARAAARTLAGLAQLPYVIGADWFQYFDEPRHGRADGENYNFGLVDIQDQPYEELVSALSAVAVNRLKAAATPTRLEVSGGVPPAPASPWDEFAPMTALKGWDRERGFVPPVTEAPLADLYLCWTPQAIYLGLYAMDIIEDAYYRDRSLPKIDRPLWCVQINGQEEVRARLGAGREALVSQADVPVRNLSGLNLNTRNIAIMEISAAKLGKTQFRVGDVVALNVTLATHCRAYRMGWQGNYTLAQ